MCLERLESLHSLEGLKSVEGLERCERLEPRSWAFGCFFDCVEVQNGQLWESLFSNYLGITYPFKNWLEQTIQKGKMVGLFEPICMGYRTEGASPP